MQDSYRRKYLHFYVAEKKKRSIYMEPPGRKLPKFIKDDLSNYDVNALNQKIKDLVAN